MGLRFVLQPRPLYHAFYAISVRRLGILPAASFRFRLTADTLAVRLTLPTTKRVVDFHHQAIAHGGRTKISRPQFAVCFGVSVDTRYGGHLYPYLLARKVHSYECTEKNEK